MLSSTPLKLGIHKLLSVDNLYSKDLEKLLKGIVLIPEGILWINMDAQAYAICLIHIMRKRILCN